jgi:hypothetical protein
MTKPAAIIIAIGIVLGAVVIAPQLLWSVSWVASLIALATWIGIGPTLMRRRQEQRTNAGWLAGIGLYGTAVFLGASAAIGGLYFSAASYASPEIPQTIPVDASPEYVISTSLGIESRTDMSSDVPGIVITQVYPGRRAETLGFEEGHRIIAANGVQLADRNTDPIVSETQKASRLADSASRALDSMRLGAERERQLLAVAQQQLSELRGRRQDAEFLDDSLLMNRLQDEEQQKTDSVALFERQVAQADLNVQTGSVFAAELRARQQLAEQALGRSGYPEWLERQSRLMVSRLARELKTPDRGKTVLLDVMVGDSPRTVEIKNDLASHDVAYSPIALALLILGNAAAIGMMRLSGEATQAVAKISTERSFESRHVVWQRLLNAAAASSSDGSARKILEDCEEAARYASRDPSARGVPVNAEIDLVVEALCQTPAPSLAELGDLSGKLKSLVVRRENTVRALLTAAAHAEH